MSRRLFVGAAIVIWSFAPHFVRSANAQVRTFVPALPIAMSFTDVVTTAVAKATEPAKVAQARIDMIGVTKSRTFGMLPFYAGSVILQAMDVHSTFKVLDRGGREGNPMLAGIANNRPAFVAIKAGIAAGSIYAVSRIAKHNKIAAMAMAAALNSTYAMIVSHNYKLAASLR